MSLKARILLILVSGFVLQLGVDYVVQHQTITPSFEHLERQEAIEEIQRCVADVENEIQHLDLLCDDWAAWDDMCRYVQDGDPDFVRSNLSADCLTTVNVQIGALCDSNGQLVWSGGREDDRCSIERCPPELCLPMDIILRKINSPQDSVGGLYSSPHGLLAVAARPVIGSDRQGPVRGILILARRVDDAMQHAIVADSSLTLNVWPIGSESIPLADRGVRDSITDEQPVLLRELDENTLNIYSTMSGVDGRPAALLRVQMPRTIMAQGEVTARQSRWALLASCVMVLALTAVLFRREVLSPLARLMRHFQSVRTSGDLSTRLNQSGQDEIAQVADEFDRLLEALESNARELRESRERYRALVDNLPIGLARSELTSEAHFVLANPAAARVLGFDSPQEMCDTPVATLYHDPEVRERLVAKLRRHGRVEGEELELIRPDGSTVWISMNASLTRDDATGREYLDGLFADITERKLAHQRLQAERNFVSAVVETAGALVLVVDPDGHIVRWNRACERTTGYAMEEVRGRNILDVAIPPAERQAIAAALEQVKQSGAVPSEYENHWQTKSGRRRRITWANTAMYDANGSLQYIIATGIDVTERRQAEEQARLQIAALESADNGVIISDADGTIQWVNQAFTRLTGYERDEVIGRNPRMLKSGHHAGDFYADLWKTIRAGRIWHGEMVNRRKDGSHYTEEMRIAPVLDASGKITHYVAIKQDVSDRVRAETELRRAKAAAESANEAKGEFLATVSHEFRTPLNGVIGMLDLAAETELTGRQKEYLSAARASATSLLAMINHLLDYSKVEKGRIELETIPFSLGSHVADISAMLAPRAQQKGIALNCNIRPDVPDRLVGDPGRLMQVLINLVANAIKFTPRGSVDLDISRRSGSDGEACLHFAVRDTGIGIPPQKQKVIFEPFRQADGSTTRRFGGTGLGLTIASRLVEQMGGAIQVRSRPDCGSTFEFSLRLPIADEPAGDAVAGGQGIPVAAPIEHVRPLRILAAEDNQLNQRVLTELLGRRGHVVVVATDGQAAVQSVSDNGPFDLVLMDVQMPGMDGLEATAEIRRLERDRRHTPIVAMTAHARKSDRDECMAAGMDAYVSKPISKDELLQLVARIAAGLPAADESPAPASAAPGKQVFDRNAALHALDDDVELLHELAQTFLDGLDVLCTDLADAVGAGNAREIHRLAHIAKGSLHHFRAEPARLAALALENTGRENRPDEAAALLAELQTQLDRVRDALLAELNVDAQTDASAARQ